MAQSFYRDSSQWAIPVHVAAHPSTRKKAGHAERPMPSKVAPEGYMTRRNVEDLPMSASCW
jgi:hypothetical protein